MILPPRWEQTVDVEALLAERVTRFRRECGLSAPDNTAGYRADAFSSGG